MIVHKAKAVKRKQTTKKQRCGKGLLNKIINNLSIELHLPGYQYCGPGTKLAKRLARGDPGINPLDAACKEHDIAYSKERENLEARNAADKVLTERAWQRVFAKDANLGEKAAAWAVTNAMKAKTKFGMGIRKPATSLTLRKVINAAKQSMVPGNTAQATIKSALKGAREAVKKAGGKQKVRSPRILPLPSKVGGFLPFLILIFAGLSATGALAGGAAGIAKAVNDASSAKRQLEESQRHNKTMEAIALGKGLHLKPYKKGLGLHLKPYGKGHSKNEK
jgi:hypothetical protein